MKKEPEYYRLNTQAVEDLVTASRENTPPYTKEELEKYRSPRGRVRIPHVLKVLLIKLWFYGALCYFVFWGLSLYLRAQLDLYFAAAVILGMVTDILINRALRFTEKMPGGSDPWIMVTRRGTAGFFLNILYAGAVLFLVITAYGGLNMLLYNSGLPVLNVEPLSFGVIALGADALCLGVKRTLKKIAADARGKGR